MNYRSMCCLQYRALAHTEQQAIKGPKITSVKPFKRENQRSNLYKKKRETRNTYKLHKQTTTTVHKSAYKPIISLYYVKYLNSLFA